MYKSLLQVCALLCLAGVVSATKRPGKELTYKNSCRVDWMRKKHGQHFNAKKIRKAFLSLQEKAEHQVVLGTKRISEQEACEVDETKTVETMPSAQAVE